MKKYLLFGVILLVSFVAYYCVIKHYYPNMTERGQFGDMFGGINALFSGLAFLGVVYAIILQREELSLQRDELKLTRDELRRTAEAQERSEEALFKQAASLKVTAKLNGLSAILQHKSSMIEAIATGKYHRDGIPPDIRREAEDLIFKIENIISEK